MGLLSKLQNVFGGKQSSANDAPAESMYGPPDRILDYRWLASDYLKHVLELEDGLVSDESTLWDFHDEDDNEAIYQKTMERYGIDVRDVPDANFLNILEKINRESHTKFWAMEDPKTAPQI